MRDPKRIGPFCNRLARAWSAVPDLRFGQFMMNVLGEMSNTKDPWFPEDPEMIEFIEDWTARYGVRRRETGE